jgi:cellulose synthase/poly-beta-1,6-N-acetylglucosamine synthase-like glycosyltransferase
MHQRSLRLFTIWTTLSIVLILIISFGTIKIAVAQQLPDKTESTNYNSSSAITDRLDKIINLLNQSRHGSLIALYLTIIAFLMGLAFVIFGLYIGQEHKLNTFTKRLYLSAYFALIVPVTVIVIQYIVNAMLSGELDDPILSVAFLLLIPITASYILMIVKSRRAILPQS